ncbi:CRISPR-associated protein Cas4 [Pyrofollis japonicus]|uniref:CRISPR-associated protein Cas4 n=1 Tax=Pyrofollis japonicus TaxID=3060460 RepID=UPI00295B9723|nr:CRISPR-associated protein Cas4 [Pyrofollis japonicus]
MSSSLVEDVLIPIGLVKEYYWCPMEAYFKLMAWREAPTESMMAGAEIVPRDRIVELLEERHRVHELLWEHPVVSRRLRLGGRVDLVAITVNDAVVVVEAKLSKTSRRALRGRDKRLLIQLAAYAIAAEEALRLPLEAAYVYSTEVDKLIEAKITPLLRRLVEHAAKELRRMLLEAKPPETVRTNRRRCRVCSYRHVCPFAR